MSTAQNVLLITSDQQHWFTLGCQNPEVKTPHLDRLASMGLLAERAYCPNPTCTPTRASLITGVFPSQHGAWSLGTKLPEDTLTIGDLIRQAGGTSTLVGKAHFQPLASTDEFPSVEAYPTLQNLDFWRDFQGPWYGFDQVELARNHGDESHVGQHYMLWMEEKGFDWRPYFNKPTGIKKPDEGEAGKGPSQTWGLPGEMHMNTWIVDRCLNQMTAMAEDTDHPHFLWASFFDPHPPYLVPEPWASMYDPKDLTIPELTPGEHINNPLHHRMTQEPGADFSIYKEKDGNGNHGFGCHLRERDEVEKNMATYYGMISFLDHCVGQLLDQLEKLHLLDSTLVIFTTDHGHFFGQHGLNAKGAFHYEDMIRVPFLAAKRGTIPENQRSSAMVSLVDFAPTALSSLGLPIPREWTGKDQMEVFMGNSPSARDHIIVENHHNPTTVHAKTYVDARYKITVYQKGDEGEIFDLEKDPGEVKNLWKDSESLTLKTELLLKLQQAEMAKEPMWMPRIAGA
jgi:arylsulfatase A-like enzyme